MNGNFNMRKIIFLKGPPGCGKSTFVSEMGFTPYSLSMDDIRLINKGADLNPQGRIQIPQDENHKVYAQFIELIEKRMERGEFLVLDALFAKEPNNLFDMMKKYRYEGMYVDFSSMPLEKILAQNDARPEYKHVSSYQVERIYQKMKEDKAWPGVKRVMWDDGGKYKNKTNDWARHKMLDMSHYERVIHIGDLQGCYSVVVDGGPLDGGWDEKAAYVFVGDLLDRGVENGKVMRWFVDEALERDNVYLIWGNHEDHINRYALGMESVSNEFENKTLPQLIESKITKEEANRVCEKAIEALFYEYNGQRVMVTHAGLPTIPAKPELISLRQYSKGTGYWDDPIDEQFERNAPSDWIQVHGHRNHGWREIRATPRSFNLEDQVEFGGHLRWCVLDKNGWQVFSNKNKVYKVEESSKVNRKKIKWKNQGVTLSQDTAKTMREHSGVKERVQILHPHISSFNFTKDVFFKASWDDVVVKARGFFINTQTNEIVSRGYDKFFNIGERKETRIEELSSSISFPLVGYLKENGFLGNIGYDRETESLFVATKSSSGGEFCQWFKDILNSQMSQVKQDGLARWLRDNEACMTFEVIDPVNDPHMIEYDEPKLILLDVFHRNESAERLDYEKLKKVAKKFDFIPKARSISLHNKEGLERWYEKVATDLSWRYHGEDVEGFVLEDSKGFMTKIKMPHYAFWKRMRGQKDRMKREWDKTLAQIEYKNKRIDANPLSREPRPSIEKSKKQFSDKWEETGNNIHPLGGAFLKWCAGQPSETWSWSIIELRNEFMKSGPDLELWNVPYDEYVKMNNKPEKEVENKGKRKIGGLG